MKRSALKSNPETVRAFVQRNRKPLERRTPRTVPSARSMPRRMCAVCGEPYEPIPGSRKCCSLECAHELRVRNARERERRRRERRNADVPGTVRTKCARPGCQQPLAKGADYCSPACHYADRTRRGLRRTQAYHRCRNCGEVFVWNGKGRGVYCSRPCKDKSGAGGVRSDPDVVQVIEVRGYRRSDFRDDHPCCRNCGATTRPNHHHVVFRQHVERAGGDRWHPNNALRLCVDCHADGHAKLSIPLGKLRYENLVFAFELWGAYAADYLRRRYAGDDPRLAEFEQRCAAA